MVSPYEWIVIGSIVLVQTGGAVKWAYSTFVPHKQLEGIETSLKELAAKDVEILTVKIDSLTKEIQSLKKFIEEHVQWKS